MNVRSTSRPLLESLTSENVVTRSLLQSRAALHPDRHFAQFEDGTCWTYHDALLHAVRAANVLTERNVVKGSCVGVVLPNGPDFLRAWFGAAMVGAIVLPINPAIRGAMLARALSIGQPTVIVGGPSSVAVDELRKAGQATILDASMLLGENTAMPALTSDIGLWDDEKWLMTSGTTGPSKLVRIPYLYAFWGYTTILMDQGFGPEDVFQIDLPLFHTAAMGYVNATLATGAAIYVRGRPALDKYWEVARDARVSGGILISSMVPAMMGHPPRAAERAHRLRFMVTSPIPPDITAFRQRFGVSDIVTSFGSTETSTPLRGHAQPGYDPSYCGETAPGFEVRLVDDRDQEVAPGDIGEAVVRCSRPFVMSPGYVDDLSATGHAWRNGWFHTGDLLRKDGDGRFYFVGRTKDVIRRRGENISAYEVELGIASHPAVAEVVCVPVPSDSGVEDEVKAWVVRKAGSSDGYVDLLEHAHDCLPHYMVPRYYEFIESVPKTATGKPQKYVLRDRGVSGATWDSHKNGYIVTRNGIQHISRAGDSDTHA